MGNSARKGPPGKGLIQTLTALQSRSSLPRSREDGSGPKVRRQPQGSPGTCPWGCVPHSAIVSRSPLFPEPGQAQGSRRSPCWEQPPSPGPLAHSPISCTAYKALLHPLTEFSQQPWGRRGCLFTVGTEAQGIKEPAPRHVAGVRVRTDTGDPACFLAGAPPGVQAAALPGTTWLEGRRPPGQRRGDTGRPPSGRADTTSAPGFPFSSPGPKPIRDGRSR